MGKINDILNDIMNESLACSPALVLKEDFRVIKTSTDIINLRSQIAQNPPTEIEPYGLSSLYVTYNDTSTNQDTYFQCSFVTAGDRDKFVHGLINDYNMISVKPQYTPDAKKAFKSLKSNDLKNDVKESKISNLLKNKINIEGDLNDNK